MRAEFTPLATLLVVLVTLSAALVLHTFLGAVFTSVEPGSSSDVEFVPPPTILEVNSRLDPETNKTQVCFRLYNPSTTFIDLNGARMVVPGAQPSIIDVSSPDCGATMPPSGVCTICGETSVPQTSRKDVSITLPGTGGAITVDATVVESPLPDPAVESVSFRTLLHFAPPHPDRYSGVLFFGEHNSAEFNVGVHNGGTASADVNVSVKGPCLRTAYTVVSLAPGERRYVVLTTETNGAFPACTVTVRASVSGAEIDPSNDAVSITIPVVFLAYCSDKPSCESALYDAAARDANTVVVLTADILDAEINVTNVTFDWKVTFDGNGHKITRYGDYAVYMDHARGLIIRNLNTKISRFAIYLSYSSAQLYDVNSHTSTESALHVGVLSRAVVQDSNLISDYYYGLVVGSGGEANVYDSLIQGFRYALFVESSGRLRLYRSTVRAARDYGLYVGTYGFADISESNVGASSYGLYLYRGVAVLHDSNVYASSQYAAGIQGEINVDLSSGPSWITSPGYDWYVTGELNVYCINCGSFCLETNFTDVNGDGTLNYDCPCVCS